LWFLGAFLTYTTFFVGLTVVVQEVKFNTKNKPNTTMIPFFIIYYLIGYSTKTNRKLKGLIDKINFIKNSA
jgi:hypothetical protein